MSSSFPSCCRTGKNLVRLSHLTELPLQSLQNSLGYCENQQKH